MPGLVPGIPLDVAMPCHGKRDGRDIGERSDAVLRTAVPGHDNERVRYCAGGFGFFGGFAAEAEEGV
jgi:hypothetical protein